MFTSIEVSLLREHNWRLAREIDAYRLGEPSQRGTGPGPHRTARGPRARGPASLPVGLERPVREGGA